MTEHTKLPRDDSGGWIASHHSLWIFLPILFAFSVFVFVFYRIMIMWSRMKRAWMFVGMALPLSEGKL